MRTEDIIRDLERVQRAGGLGSTVHSTIEKAVTHLKELRLRYGGSNSPRTCAAHAAGERTMLRLTSNPDHHSNKYIAMAVVQDAIGAFLDDPPPAAPAAKPVTRFYIRVKERSGLPPSYLSLSIDSGGMSSAWVTTVKHAEPWLTRADAEDFVNTRLKERYPGTEFIIEEAP
jgi:hypothetical protein